MLGPDLVVTGRTHDIGQNVLQSCFETESSISPSYDTYFFVDKNPTRCYSMQIFIYCKATLHVSGASTHHQEY